MASLVLGAAGSIVGGMFFGPIGAAVGQLAGSALGNLIDPEKIEGPRLNDLKLGTSEYGSMIPIVYGKDRIPGQVIFQTDLEEHSDTDNGKGGPQVTTYTYTASFASLICANEIVDLLRIWADKRLVHDRINYDAQTDFPFTLYYGTETQLPDPTMEAVLGAGNVPGHRGYAYIVCTDLPLGDYGNRIPMLEFEVVTREHTNAALHIVKIAEGLPIKYRDIEIGSDTGPMPSIVSWPFGDSGIVRVAEHMGALVHEYQASDLSYIGQVAKSVDDVKKPDDRYLEGPTTFMAWRFAGIGYYMLGGNLVPLWARNANPINSGTSQNPALAAGDLFLDASEFPNTGNNFAANLGLTDGEFVTAAVMSQDRTMLFLFTGTGSTSMNAWHKVVEGVVVDTGTIEGGLAPNMLGYGSSSILDVNVQCAEFENNGIWCWAHHSSDSGVKTFYIDDSNVFRYNALGGIGLYAVAHSFKHTSLMVLTTGYCGLVVEDELIVYSRFPLGETLAIPLGEIVADICDRCGLTPPSPGEYDVSQLTDPVDGYTISTQSPARNLIDQLRPAYFFDVVESGELLKFVKRGAASVATIPDEQLAATVWGEDPPPLLATTRLQEEDLPAWVNVNYKDRDTDYQQGHQYDRRQATQSRMIASTEFPIVMPASDAKRIAQILLFLPWIERDRHSLWTSRKYLYLEPTDVVEARGKKLRITGEKSGASGVLQFDAVPTHDKVWIAGHPSTGGQGYNPTLPPVDQRTDLLVMDLPLLNDNDEELGKYVAVAGRTSPRWRGCSLFRSTDGGINYTSIGLHGTANTFGRTESALGDFFSGNIFDELNSISVTVSPGGGALSSISEGQALNGGNLALIGNEIVNFKNAVLTSASVYTLSGFLRGRRGTEWVMDEHVPIEQFVMLGNVTDYDENYADLNVERKYKAVTFNDTLANATEVGFRNTGQRLVPLSPVLLGGGAEAGGDVHLHWTRRSRITGGSLIADPPLGEPTEEYILEIRDSTYALVARIISVLNDEAYEYTSAMQVTDFGANQQTIYFSVGQIGRLGIGRRAFGTAPGMGGSNTAPLAPVGQYGGVPPPPPGPGAGTADDRHYANFLTIFYDAGSSPYQRQLAYNYTTVANGINAGWYVRYQGTIRDNQFGGSQWQNALWIQDASVNLPYGNMTQAEYAYLFGLANAAGA